MKNILSFLLVFLFLSAQSQVVLNMKKVGGVYEVPCKVNGLNLSFIFDTGASDVSISLIEALFMIRHGYLKEENILGKVQYSIANGDIAEGTRILLKDIEIGGLKLTNVEASIVHEMEAPLLLGQSAIQKLGEIQIKGNQLTILNSNNGSDKTYYQNQVVRGDNWVYFDKETMIPINGKLITYHPNGKTKSIENFVQGIWNGSYKSFWENGKSRDERNYLNGDLNGVYKSWHETGQLLKSYFYEKNILIVEKSKQWAPSGSSVSIEEMLSSYAGGEAMFKAFGLSEDGKKEKALKILNHILELIGNYNLSVMHYFDVYPYMATIYNDLENYELAISTISKLIELKQTDLSYFLQRAELYMKVQSYEKAVLDFEKVIKLGKPEDIDDALYNLGIIYYELGNYKKSIQNLDKAIELCQPTIIVSNGKSHNFGLRSKYWYYQRGLSKEKAGLSFCADMKKGCDLGDKRCCDYKFLKCE